MRHNLRRGIHRGESSPRLAGWGTQPLRIQLTIPHSRAHVPIFVPPGVPLGLNASQFHPSWGEVSSPSGLGNPTPTDPTSRAHVPIFVPPCSPVAPLGLWLFGVCACYKHVAPLGLNAAQFAARYPSWGEFSSPSGLGNPTPTDSTSHCSRSNFRASRFTCRPSGALGYLVYCACYKHVAPLGLNAAQFAARYPSWGEFSSPSGLGNPTPTGSTVCDNTTLRSSGARRLDVSRCYRHVAPLGLNASQFAARYPSWGEFSSPSGLGNPTPTDPTSVLTFQFSCLPVHMCAPLERGDWMCRAAITCRPSGAKCGTICGAVSIVGRGLLA